MVDYIKLYSIIIPVIVSLDIYWDILKLDYIITGIFTGIHYNWEISPLLLDYLHFPSLDRRFNVPFLLETLLIASIPSSHDIPITLLWYSHAIRIIIPMAFPFYSPTKSNKIRFFFDSEKLLQARFLQWYTCWRDMKIDVQPSPQPDRVGRDNGNSRTLTCAWWCLHV